MQEKAPFD